MAGASLLYLVGTLALTLRANQPMNLRLGAMDPAAAVAYWPHFVQRWSTWNHVRTTASLLSAALFVAAIVS